MGDKEVKKDGFGSWKWRLNKILSTVAHFVPEGSLAVVDSIRKAIEDPTTIEPLIEGFFDDMLKNMKMPCNHIRYSMGFNEHRKMQYIIEVWNPHQCKWITIDFPASRYIANAFNEELRNKQVALLQQMIAMAHGDIAPDQLPQLDEHP